MCGIMGVKATDSLLCLTKRLWWCNLSLFFFCDLCIAVFNGVVVSMCVTVGDVVCTGVLTTSKSFKGENLRCDANGYRALLLMINRYGNN